MIALFGLMALLLLASAFGVVLCKNPIHSALCLVTNLLGVAVLFAMLDAHFLAMVQIIVYAGAIMVLVVFVLMLLNLKEEGDRRGVVFPTLVILAAAALGWVSYSLFSGAAHPFQFSVPAVQGTVFEIGQLLYREYLYPFEVASLLIMIGLVGAVMLARRRTKGAS